MHKEASINQDESANADDLLGIVQTQYVTLFDDSNPLTLGHRNQQNPVQLNQVEVAYETYGKLSAAKDNAIFVCHALTGDAHAAGWHSEAHKKPGWWHGFIGPGRGLDTNKYYIICANVLGGCQGTTGPGSTDPATGKPYGLNFPFLTVGDIVKVHAELVKHLGINKLLSVIGGSLGGMQVLDWAVRYPEQMASAIVLASSTSLSAQGIAFNAVGRRAITTDPDFRNGQYYEVDSPQYGLALARMIAHITYLSEDSIELKFGRRLQEGDRYTYDMYKDTEFQIESYLHYQGKRFVERFDANSYLYLTRAMDYFDLAEEFGSLNAALSRTAARFLVTSYTTDWLFPTSQSLELVTELVDLGKHVTFLELESPYGHDSFLIQLKELAEIIVPFLDQLYQTITVRESH